MSDSHNNKNTPPRLAVERGASLAKVSMPRLAQGVARPRLFEILDRVRQGGAAWLVAPSGAGKTTLIATYVIERQLPYIWYKLDSDDADPATFFYYLGLAAKTTVQDSKLPLLTPEYLPDVSGFARRYFRDLFSALPRGTVIVLDNHQDAGGELALDIILRSAIDETPVDSSLIVMSRINPPACLVRHKVGGQMELIAWDLMRLTSEETSAIAEGAGLVEQEVVQALHERCEGWAAGLTLMLEHAKLSGNGDKVVSLGALESIFDYFASELFDNLTMPTRDFLLKTSLLPYMTAVMAKEVSGNQEGGNILADLYHRHFFTNRWDVPEVTYQYHALFREFLLLKAEQAYTRQEYRALVDRVGQLLHSQDQDQEAVPLYLRTRQWEKATSIILSQAPRLLAQGRGRTVAGWIQQIPEEHVTADPWMLYWYGVSLQFMDFHKATSILECACNGFLQRDPLGRLLATSAIIDIVFHTRGNLIGVVPWVDSLKSQLLENPVYPSPHIEARVLSSLVSMLELMGPNDPVLPQYVERLGELLSCELDVNEKMLMAGRLIIYHAVISGSTQDCDHILRYVRSLQGSHELTAACRCIWQFLSVLPYLFCNSGSEVDREPVEALFGMIEDGDMREQFEENSLPTLEFPSSYYATLLYLQSGDTAAARPLIRRMEALVTIPESIDMALLTMAKCQYAFVQGDWITAHKHGQISLQIHRSVGATISGLELGCMMAIQCGESGRPEEAFEYLAPAREQGFGNSPRMRYQMLLVESYVYLLLGEIERCHVRMREAFVIGRDQGCWTRVFWLMKIAPRLCAEALRAGIEVERVRRLIGELDIPPADPCIENWPWLVRVYTMGHFRLVIDGQPFEIRNQRQKKPLQLLGILIAMGGSGVKKEKLADIMWPDADADAALYALGTTLARLRKIIGEKSVILKGGRVSVSERICWWDVQAMEVCFDEVEESDMGPEDMEGFIDKMMKLYKGPFLSNEEGPWFDPLRDRLRSRFSQFVAAVCRSLNEAGMQERAAAIVQRALQTDPACKGFIERLMPDK